VDLRGRHDDAAELLRRAESSLSDPAWRYYAALYLGRAEESRGNDAEAHAAYTRAAMLFPRAQSPQLALADLKWRGADQEGALSGLRALFAMPDTASRDADPWWLYDVSHVGDLTAPFEALRLASAEVLR
jgi:tetratricopeptide (TPR) repeat protein